VRRRLREIAPPGQLRRYAPNLMLLRRTTQTLILSALLMAPLTIRGQKQSQLTCALLDRSHTAQFISYERASASDVYFRLHNNTSCPIVIETDDQAPIKSGPGRFVHLHYLVHDRRRQSLRVAYGWGDSSYTLEISSGDSVTFAVPMSQVSKHLDLAVPFNYAWDGDVLNAQAVGGVRHLVYFLWDTLPLSVRKRP